MLARSRGFWASAAVPGIPVPGICRFFGGIGTGIGTNWYREKVSEPVSVKFGIGKKSRNRYWENLVPEKSLGTVIGTNLIPELIFVAKN